MLAAPVLLAACKKDGTLFTEKEIIRVSVASYWADAEAVSSLTISNTLMADSFGSRQPVVSGKVIGRVSGKQQVQLKNLKTGSVWLDTALDIPGNDLSVRILQLEKEKAPQLLVSNNEAPDPSKRYFGFTYSDPNLPESLTLELYAMVVQTPNIIISGGDKPAAVFENIERGRFIGFTDIAYFAGFENRRFVFKLKNAKTGEYLPNADALDPFRYQKGGRMAVRTNMNTDANYIFDIKRNVASTGNITYRSDILVAY